MSLSRTTGKFKLVENGHIAAEKQSEDIIQHMKKIPFEVSVRGSLFKTHVYSLCMPLGWHIHPGLFLPEPGGEVHVQHDDARLGDGRPGVQQGAQHRGDGGHHILQVSGVCMHT